MPTPTAVVVPFVVNAGELAARASKSLGLSNGDLAKIAGCSPRTVSRWWSSESTPGYTAFQALARVVFPTDAAFAAELARAGGVTLEQLGLKSPPSAAPAAPPVAAPPPAPPLAAVPTRLLAEAVVCCAAEELDAPPRAVRGILRAAFRRAREMRLSVEAMDDALSPPPVEAPSAPPRAPKAAGKSRDAKAVS